MKRSDELKKEIQRLTDELNKVLIQEEEEGYPEDFGVYDAYASLKDSEYLDVAFDWHSTPQGYAYWDNRYTGICELSIIDKNQILKWIVNYYRHNQNK